MARMTIRMPDEKHERVKSLARHRGVSVNQFMVELATMALAEFDTRSRFQMRGRQGDSAEGLAILDALDQGDQGWP